MKQCAVCSRTYTDDTMEFCLDDGARLFIASDPEATRVRGENAAPPTAAWPPQPLPPPDWSQEPTPVRPVPAQKSRLWIPLTLALLAAGVMIGGALFWALYVNQPAESAETIAETKDSPTPAATPKLRPSPEATPDSKPTPKPTATPVLKPTPDTKPTPVGEPTVKPTPKPESGGCRVSNDAGPDINLRANCNIKSCDDDSSTIIGTVRNGTPVTVNRSVATVRGRGFDWQQVTVNGRTGWIAASKYRCN